MPIRWPHISLVCHFGWINRTIGPINRTIQLIEPLIAGHTQILVDNFHSFGLLMKTSMHFLELLFLSLAIVSEWFRRCSDVVIVFSCINMDSSNQRISGYHSVKLHSERSRESMNCADASTVVTLLTIACYEECCPSRTQWQRDAWTHNLLPSVRDCSLFGFTCCNAAWFRNSKHCVYNQLWMGIHWLGSTGLWELACGDSSSYLSNVYQLMFVFNDINII